MATKKASPFSLFNDMLRGKKYDDLSSEETKVYSQYMINSIVSMNMENIMYSDIIQKYTNIPDKVHYEFYQELLPNRVSYKYISSKSDNKYSAELINLMCKQLKISKKEAIENLDVLIEVKKFNVIEDFVSKFGYDKREIKKIIKVKK